MECVHYVFNPILLDPNVFDQDIQDPCLSELHLSTLMDGLRGYIPEQNRSGLGIFRFSILS